MTEKKEMELTHLMELARCLMGREKDDMISTQAEDREFLVSIWDWSHRYPCCLEFIEGE